MASSTRLSTHKYNGNQQFWTEFFALYENLPALWDARDPLYKERQAKLDGYEQLVTKMREVEPNACREDVLRKINIFRTNYRRECTRINASRELGKRYRTSLWYFNALHFLQSQESRGKDRRSQRSEDKSILRRKISKSQSMRAMRQAVVLEAKNRIKDERRDFASPVVKYENYSAEGTESEEHVAHVQYTDENSFQQQFQTQFHTLSFDRRSAAAAPAQAAQHRHSFDDDNDADEDKYVTEAEAVADAEAEAAAFHELINLDDSAQTHEILEEIEEEEQMCGKMTITAAPLPTIAPAKQLTHATMPKKASEPHVTGALSVHCMPQQPERIAGGDRTISAASEILAKSWAIQYEEMSTEQRIYARKAIAEILFEGCLGHLGRRRDGSNRTMTTVVRAAQYETAGDSDEEDVDNGGKMEQVEEDIEDAYPYADT